MGNSEDTQEPVVEAVEEPLEASLPGSEEDEVEYDGSGDFGSAEDADTDDFEVDEDDEEWGL